MRELQIPEDIQALELDLTASQLEDGTYKFQVKGLDVSIDVPMPQSDDEAIANLRLIAAQIQESAEQILVEIDKQLGELEMQNLMQ